MTRRSLLKSLLSIAATVALAGCAVDTKEERIVRLTGEVEALEKMMKDAEKVPGWMCAEYMEKKGELAKLKSKWKANSSEN